MADAIRVTPYRYASAGTANEIIGGLLGYLRDPRRTQQMQGLAGLLESTGIPKTVERLAYGEPLTNINRANVPMLKPETAEALLTLLPVPAGANKAAKAIDPAVQKYGPKLEQTLLPAFEAAYNRGGLPREMVEAMGTASNVVPQKTQSIVREGNPIQSAVVLIGDKIFTGRTHTDAFNRAIYEGVVRKENGKFIYPKDAEVNSDLFMTKDGQIIDRIQASKMFDIGASETAIKEGLMQNKPASSMSVDSYIEQANAIKQQRERNGGLLEPQNAEASEAVMRTFKTSDGYTLYELPNGKIVDNLDPEVVDMSWDSFKQLKDDFGDDVYQVQDEVGKRRAAISSTGNPNLLDDFASFMATPDQQDLYQQALNKQKKAANNVVPFPKSSLLD